MIAVTGAKASGRSGVSPTRDAGGDGLQDRKTSCAFQSQAPRWELWSNGFDDENHYREIYAVGPSTPIPLRVAAIHLLAAAWKATYNHEPWYRVGREGLVSADEIDAVFEMLFPEPANAEPESPSAAATEETTHE